MFHHVSELRINARVANPDERFAKLVQKQFGRHNGVVKAVGPFE